MDEDLYEISTHARGPIGRLPLDAEYLRTAPSGEIFGLSQDAGMGWDPRRLRAKEFLILSTQGGLRAPDGTPVALGYHTGTLGGRLARGGRRAADCRVGRDPLRRLRQRPLRRPHPGHAGHDG